MTNNLGNLNNTNQKHKPFDNIDNSSKNTIGISHRQLEIKITTCLTEDHKNCTGKYSNSSGNLIVNCICNCHNQEDSISTKK